MKNELGNYIKINNKKMIKTIIKRKMNKEIKNKNKNKKNYE